MRDTESQRHRKREEKQDPYREPDVGLDPGTPGIMPWAKGRHLTTEPLRDPHCFIFFLKILFIYSWETQRERGRGRDTGRGRSRLHARSLTWDSIPRSWDHALSQRQTLNSWAAQASWWWPFIEFLLHVRPLMCYMCWVAPFPVSLGEEAQAKSKAVTYTARSGSGGIRHCLIAVVTAPVTKHPGMRSRIRMFKF